MVIACLMSLLLLDCKYYYVNKITVIIITQITSIYKAHAVLGIIMHALHY